MIIKDVIVGLLPDDCIIHFECATLQTTGMEQSLLKVPFDNNAGGAF